VRKTNTNELVLTLPMVRRSKSSNFEDATVSRPTAMTQATHRILIVDDDRAIRRILRSLFESHRFRVLSCESCASALRETRLSRPDICIVDLGLPDGDGLDFIREIRPWSSVPILVLTARSDGTDRLAAFEAGADDYVVKPFCVDEVLARVRAILRRGLKHLGACTLTLGAASIDLGRRVARGRNGEERRLTPLEHRILECLLRYAGDVVPHGEILREVWGPHQSDMRGLRVYITSLRRKLEADPLQPRHILTEPGIGYRLETNA
jgi:two-component system, OmpR family, KDP operon response regulator KdpE